MNGMWRRQDGEGQGRGWKRTSLITVMYSFSSFLFNKYSLTPKALQTVGLRVFQTSVIGAPSSQLLAKAMKQNDVLNP